MSTEIARVLKHLREEKGIKQKAAAEAMGISSGLLSHYEKGIRSPKLDFLVRAAEHYGVTSDYLLGVSNLRGGETISVEDLYTGGDNSGKMLGKGGARVSLGKAVTISAINVLFDLMRDDLYRDFSVEAQNYLSISIYKVFRHLYNSNDDNLKSLFAMPDLAFLEAGNAASQMSELKLKLYSAKIASGKSDAPEINYDFIKENFHRDAPAFFNVLKMAEDAIEIK